MSDFNLWVDGWGAAAATETLLDARLQALPESDQKCLQDNLNQLKDALSQGLSVERSEKSMRNVDFLVSQLAKDAVAIRRREAQPRIAAKSHEGSQYPSPPEAGDDLKCPCCCQYLPGTMATDTNAWRQHILKDIQPFICIAEGCPTPGVLYSTRRDWERHVEMDHRPNLWLCPICRDMGTATENVKTLLTHIGDHHADAIPQKDAVHVIHAGGFTSYGITSCPLCTETGSLDSPDLIDHVLQHTRDFALQALPWPKQTQDHAPAPGSRPGTYNMRLLTDPDYVRSWLNEVTLDLRTWDEAAEEPAQHSSSAWDYFDRNPYFADDSSSGPFPATLSERTGHMSGGEEAIDHQVEGS
ncbi:hypothetical protein BO82DRAFT_404837 [Aspergillus uvarum CBS 121591]|uniref:C2H2-type domain-containing protein n=1 Tax=Aspergillus uvarum CBS 121591 TaxID=1448315 RepID=A0A319C406_9EURO|nr:hypothetical protein BO82DRAFT_404837 [Aspergillus uvarum CBS 121591]PYH78777.1 hypothetical protein BO82DRAFT_404837 [Aspergillus uvarum CBS 121591]